MADRAPSVVDVVSLWQEIEGAAWRAEAACRDMGSEAFLIQGSPQLTTDQLAAVRAAKEVCGSCPVRAACLDFALDKHETGGVWGGEYLSTRRVTDLRRRRQLAA